jgi:hypothetical protein
MELFLCDGSTVPQLPASRVDLCDKSLLESARAMVASSWPMQDPAIGHWRLDGVENSLFFNLSVIRRKIPHT